MMSIEIQEPGQCKISLTDGGTSGRLLAIIMSE